MADELDKWIKHEKRLSELEPKVESLWYHHRQDRTLERLNEVSGLVRQALAATEKLEGKFEKLADQPVASAAKKDVESGELSMHVRMRWVERMMWGAIGALAMFELLVRIWKPSI